MPYCQYVNDVEYRVERRRPLFIAATVCGLAGLSAGFTLATGARYTGYGLVIFIGFSSLLIVPILVFAAFSRTALTADRLIKKEILWSRSYRWHEIDRVETEQYSSRRGSGTRIVVRLVSGKAVKLSVPYDPPNGHDPEFDVKLKSIKSRLAPVDSAR